MRKSFTRLFSLVMLLGVMCYSSFAGAVDIIPSTSLGDASEVWPLGAEALTKTTDKAMVIYAQDVVASTGSIRLSDSNGLVRVIPATDARVSFAKGDTVVVDFSADLKEFASYAVTVDEDAFKAADGTPASFEGGDVVWGWKTGDYTAPTLTDVVPEDGSVVGDNLIDLVLTFEDNDAVIAGAGNISVYKADGNLWDLITLDFTATTGNASLTGAGVVTVTGLRQLEDNVDYEVTVGAGVVTDNGKRADEELNKFAGSLDRTAWTFSTEDFTAPAYATDYPKKANVSNDSFDILVKTNESGTAYGVVYEDGGTVPADADAVRDAATVVEVAVVGGAEATLSFDGLNEETDYIAYIIVDNADVAATEIKTVAVTTGETVAPTLSSVLYDYVSTTDETVTVTANVVALNNVDQDIKSVTLTFNEEITLGAGNIIIKRVVDNTVFKTIASTDMEVDEDGAAWVKFPLTEVENNVKYYVVIPNTLVLDVYGNKYGGISSVTGWRFNSSDEIAPTYTITPAHAATNVDSATKIVLTFDELVTADAGDFRLSYSGGSISFEKTQNDNDGKFSVVTLTPGTVATPVALPSGALVQVVVEENYIEDVGGSNPIGLGDKSYSFFVEDYAGPVIESWTDSPLTSDTQAIEIKYNEGIYLLGGTEITAGNLYTILTVKKDTESGANVAANFAISDDKKVITITPATKWASEGTYYIAVSSDVEDMAGNAFAGADGDRSKTFTVNDLVAETVAINVDGETIATDGAITITFNEGTDPEARDTYFSAGAWVAYTAPANMQNVFVLKEGSADGPDVAFTVTNTGSDAATFEVVTSDLVGNKTYYIGVGPSTKDAAGNINEPKFVTFNTLFEDGPEVVALSPLDDAVEVAVDADLTVTFNTDIKLVAEAAYLSSVRVFIDGTAVPYADLSVDGATLTIAHADFAENDAVIDVTIGSGVVLNDNSDAAFTGIATTNWNFGTVDTEIIVTDLSDDAVTTATIDPDLVISFGEKVQVGTGNIDIKNFNTDVIVERIAVTSDNVVVTYPTETSTEITITPSVAFKYDTKYYVEVDAGAFVDVVGNSSDEIFGKTEVDFTDWTFTTPDPALVIETVTPASGSDKVGLTSSIVVEFNRLIAFGDAGSIGYLEDDGSTVSPQVYPVGSSNLTISGKTLTITHTDKDFPVDTKIWLSIDATAITVATDDANVLAADIDNSSDPSFYFNTGDVNAPIPTFEPAAFVNEDGKRVYVDVDSNITITFDEDIFHKDGGSVFTSGDITDDNIFELYDGATELTFVGSISGKVVTMNPDVDFDEYTTYTVKINNSTDGVADADGHVTLATSIDFMTTDLTAPSIGTFTVTGDEEFVTVSDVDVTDASGNENKFYYLIREKSGAAAPSAAAIKAANEKDATATVTGFDITGLTASTTYQFYYVADDTFGNTSAVAVKEATTDDTVAPLLVSTDPATGDVDVDVAAGVVEIELTFNEDVAAGTGAIVVREKTTNTIVATYAADGVGVLAAGDDADQLILSLAGLPAAADVMQLTVELAAGTVVDVSDAANAFAGIFGANAIAFSTEDNMLPTFEDDSDGTIATNDNIVVKFSEAVQAGTGTAILYFGSTTAADAAVEVFDAADVTFDGAYVTINPTADLENTQTYTLLINDDFALDMSSNENGNAEGSFTFDVSENVAPYVIRNSWEVSYGSPMNKGDMISTIDIDTNEDIYFEIGGIKTSILLLTDAQVKENNLVTFVDALGNSMPFTMYQCCGNDVRFDVDPDDFDHNTTYTITVQGFMDIDGLVMTPYVYTFETTDGVTPDAIFNPADEAENVNENSVLTITFNEQIYHSVSGVGPFYYEPFTDTNIDDILFLDVWNGISWVSVDFDATFNGVDVITITPDEALESGASYSYGFDGTLVDADGNSTGGDTEAEFTVRDIVKPTFELTDVVPAKKATKVLADADMSVTFSEDIMVGTGSVIIRNQDGTIFETIGAAGLSVDEDAPTVLIIDHADFAANAEYFVELQASVVVDGSGNGNVAYSDAVDGWIFTTKDTYGIEVVVSPTGDNIPRVVNLEMTFNKAVSLNTATDFGYFLTVYKEDGTAVKQIDAEDLVILGNKVTYFNLELDADQAYYARIEPNAFVDGSDNVFAGIMDNSWVFSTVDNIAPKVTGLTPADNAADVSTDTSFEVTFDRDIAVGTGMIAVRYALDGSLFEEVDVAAATIEGAVLSFDLTMPLDELTSFYVIVPAGAVTNTEITADPFAGIVNTYTWNFSTSTDLTAPELTAWTPLEETLADNHPTFTMTFDEEIVLSAAGGNLVVTEKDSTEASVTIDLADAVIDGMTVTVTYDAAVSGGLNKDTEYFVTVDAGAIEDMAGNAFGGVADETAWTFTTGADFATGFEAPEIGSLNFNVYPNPFNGYVNVDNADQLSRIVISNVAGQRVKDIVNPTNTITTGELRSGIYFITLVKGDVVVKTDRIVKR